MPDGVGNSSQENWLVLVDERSDDPNVPRRCSAVSGNLLLSWNSEVGGFDALTTLSNLAGENRLLVDESGRIIEQYISDCRQDVQSEAQSALARARYDQNDRVYRGIIDDVQQCDNPSVSVYTSVAYEENNVPLQHFPFSSNIDIVLTQEARRLNGGFIITTSDEVFQLRNGGYNMFLQTPMHLSVLTFRFDAQVVILDWSYYLPPGLNAAQESLLSRCSE